MIKNYANSKNIGSCANFVFKAAKKRRMLALNNAKDVQNELGIAPTLFAVK